MRVNTLTYIHTLLKEEVENRLKAYEFMKDTVTTALAENRPNAEFLQEQQALAWKKYHEAKNHLEDFEDQEWN